MRAVVQRVTRASVTVDGRVTGSIGPGLLVFVGVAIDDEQSDATYVAAKVAHLRIFKDENALMNRSVLDTRGAVLLVSQFTLHGDVRKGRRPSFITAGREELAEPLFGLVGSELHHLGVTVRYGEFGADMDVELLNQGPVTILIDSKRIF
ncbi:MAG: D-aminoacyl-tRNA deacylase [Candidatus Eremiobacteraeota bacterium]|nr:D-aminoacyl-tRNA deacylase [Candidatus Eremiobacteraeota bacterium]